MKQLSEQYVNVDMTWHLPHAVHPSKSKKPYDIVNSWAAQRAFRKALLYEFNQLKTEGDDNNEGIHLLDTFEMTQTRVDSTHDGNHYNNAINFMKLDMWLTSICN